jgi:hypothetical protein
MVMRLCVQRGEMRPSLALKCMGAEDVSLYQAWFRQRRFGEDQMHIMLAQLAMLINNRWRNRSEEARKLTDFIPWYIQPEQTPDEMFAVVRGAKTWQ